MLYKYGVPLGTGTHSKPVDGLVFVDDDPQYQVVWIYDRQLTTDELVRYPLEYVGVTDTEQSREGET